MSEFSVAIEIITIKPNGAQSNSQQRGMGGGLRWPCKRKSFSGGYGQTSVQTNGRHVPTIIKQAGRGGGWAGRGLRQTIKIHLSRK